MRYFLNGTLLQIRDDGLWAVATDGHRLSLASMQGLTEAGGAQDAIIPRKTVNILTGMLGSGEGDVTIAISANQIRVRQGQRCLTSKLIEGHFPDYESVIPTNSDQPLRVAPTQLAQAIQRASVVTEGAPSRAVTFKLEPQQLRVEASNATDEQAHEDLPVDYNGKSFKVAFNPRYLLDALDCIETDEAVIDNLDENTACLIRDDSDRARHKHVVMPVRV